MPPFSKGGIRRGFLGSIAWLLSIMILHGMVFAGSISAEVKRFRGQTVYVPAYSHIYTGNRELAFNLTINLSVRNTDPDRSITVTRVSYYDTQGKLVRRYLNEDKPLGPMASMRFIVKESDKSGGDGANFIVEWKSEEKVTEPIIEAVMISTASTQGVSFTSRGQAIREIE